MANWQQPLQEDSSSVMRSARDLHIRGIVQGVGFRPFIYRQAVRWGLTGWVLNASDGVHIHVEGDTSGLESFIRDLPDRAPLAAKIDTMEISESASQDLTDFSIRDSREQAQASTLVSPDIATCPQCLEELFNQHDRRYHYPFINCTNCGPRFTIISSLPYDRGRTSMAGFEMCAACEKEYRDPLDRRFHAQPDACFDCGPSLRLWKDDKDYLVAHDHLSSDRIIREVASLLCAGQIVAIKGLGGYHLACDATNELAVSTLRQRKRRTAKPFALMVRDLTQARALCQISPLEASILSGSVRPIVLLMRNPARSESRSTARSAAHSAPARSDNAPLAPSVAGSLPELGIMLPYTPTQHLLLAALDRPLVMTSGNISEEPIIAAQAEAHELLFGIADAFLDNDREILSRYDDSVVRVIDERLFMIRRARGYAPKPLALPRFSNPASDDDKPELSILATGPEQKNCICLTRPDPGQEQQNLQDRTHTQGAAPAQTHTQPQPPSPLQTHSHTQPQPQDQAFVSQHLGDLENAAAFSAWLSTLGLYQRLFNLDYRLIACDRHPEYLSSKWARAQDMPRVEVQHHHAHIAAVLAEQQALGPASDAGDISLIHQVIGIAFDGTGYGDDATIWGGELLIASLAHFNRFAHLTCVPLPGGPAAIRHPARMAWSYLKTLGLTTHPGTRDLAARIGQDRLLLLEQIIDARINSPLTSSMGRLFDAVSALAGICPQSTYEGQAAVELEAALYDPQTGNPIQDLRQEASAQRYRFSLTPAVHTEHDDKYPAATATTPPASKYSWPDHPVIPRDATGIRDATGTTGTRGTTGTTGTRDATGATGASATGDASTPGDATLPATTMSAPNTPYPNASWEFDPTPVLQAVLDDLSTGVGPALISLRFHNAVVELIAQLCETARRETGISTVALSGGVFMNRYLLSQVIPLLGSEGFTVLMNRELPANDGCISYGQAAVAAAQVMQLVG